MKPVAFENYSMWVQKKHDSDWFEWCVFVASERDVVSSIDSIEYALHPSFENPIRTISNETNRFMMASAGWGEFSIAIKVIFKDKEVGRFRHELKLRPDNWPKGPQPSSFNNDMERAVYESLFHEKFRWRKVSTIANLVNHSVADVEQVLEYFRDRNIVRKAYFQSIDNCDLWGATKKVGVSPQI